MNTLISDIRYACRTLLRNPRFTTIVVITLALGIGANTAVFSVINGVMLRPLPYEHAESLVRLYTQFPNDGIDKFVFSEPEFLELRDQTEAFEKVAAWKITAMNITGVEQPDRVSGALASSDLLPALGVQPRLGRWYTFEETLPGASPIVLISSGLWMSAFAGDESIVGRSIDVDGRAAEVIGVMFAGFEFPAPDIDLWLPLIIDPSRPHNRASHSLSVLGQLKEGLRLDAARADLARLTTAWEHAHAGSHTINHRDHPVVAFGLLEDTVSAVRPGLMVLLSAVGCVLLIACANVSSLVLTRTESRHHEVAMRAALGATRARLLRTFLAETLVLSITAGALGVLLSTWCVHAIIALTPVSIPRADGIQVDRTVLVFAFVISIATGVMCGLAPMAYTRSGNLLSAMKSQSGSTGAAPGGRLFRRSVVAAEISVAVVLALGAGLLVRSFWRLQEVKPGFEPENVLVMQISLPRAQYPDLHDVAGLYRRLQHQLEAIPGVRSASMMTELPLRYSPHNNDMYFEGVPPTSGGGPTQVDFTQWVWNGYFETMGIELVQGRAIDERDTEDAPPVAVVNEAVVQRYWRNEDPIGLRISPNGTDVYTVVGVVGNIKHQDLNREAGTEAVFSLAQPTTLPLTRGSVNVVVRTEPNALSIAPSIRSVIHALDPMLPVANLQTMENVVYASVARPRCIAQLLVVFTGLALSLMVVGVYGVVLASVERRTREIGVRMAMGAGRGHIVRLVLAEGIILAAFGTAAGVLGALVLNVAVGAQFRELLYEVTTTDAVTFISISALTIGVAALASCLPARRAAKVDPMVALRCE